MRSPRGGDWCGESPQDGSPGDPRPSCGRGPPPALSPQGSPGLDALPGRLPELRGGLTRRFDGLRLISAPYSFPSRGTQSVPPSPRLVPPSPKRYRVRDEPPRRAAPLCAAPKRPEVRPRRHRSFPLKLRRSLNLGKPAQGCESSPQTGKPSRKSALFSVAQGFYQQAGGAPKPAPWHSVSPSRARSSSPRTKAASGSVI